MREAIPAAWLGGCLADWDGDDLPLSLATKVIDRSSEFHALKRRGNRENDASFSRTSQLHLQDNQSVASAFKSPIESFLGNVC